MYQQIIIVGNLGRDPEMRFIPSGTPVTNFSVATSRRYTTSAGEKVDETTWFRITVWGKQAEACNQYLSRGKKVLVEGRLNPDENGNPRIWTGQDGSARASFEVTAETVRFLSPRNESAAADYQVGDQGPEVDEEEIPF